MSNSLASQYVQSAAKMWYWPVLRGVIAILLGLFAWVWPGVTAVVLVWILGIFLFVDGVLELGGSGRYAAGKGWHIFLGILGVLVGLALFIWPGKSAVALVILLGVWAIVAGIGQVFAAIELRKIPGAGWGWGIAAGLLLAVFGILLLAFSSEGLVALVWLVATWAIVMGILLIVFGFSVRSLGKRQSSSA